MDNLAHLIQLIVSAVNSKLTMSLTQRIAQLSEGIRDNHGHGWVDRTPAAAAIRERRIASSNSAVASATKEQSEAQRQAANAANDFLQESLNPTGKDLAELGKVAKDTASKLHGATEALAAATRENDRIKAAAISGAHQKRVETSADAVERAAQKAEEAKRRYSAVRAAVTAEQTNPTGMAPQELAKLIHAADVYRAQLDDASDALKKVTGEHEQLRRSIEFQISAAKGLSANDLNDLKSASGRTSAAASARDAAQKRYDSARAEITDEYLNPTGKTADQMQKMANAVGRYLADLDRADEALRKATAAERMVQETALKRSRAQDAADKRKALSPFAQRLRAGMAAFNRGIGSTGRKALKPITSRYKALRNAFDKTKAVERRTKARNAYAAAKSTHAKNMAAHQAKPTQATYNAVMASRQGLAAAGVELSSAEALGGVAEALAAVTEACPPLGVGLAAVAAAAVGAVTLIKVSLGTFQKVMATGEQEVERFRRQRSTFSSRVAGQIIRYDQQSRNLEARSSAATSGSAQAVVQSTMALRESNQGRSEQWEDIGNKLLATCLDIATHASNIFAVADGVLVPLGEGFITGIRTLSAALGIPLNEIAANTRKPDNLGLAILKNFNNANAKRMPEKAFPPLKPLK